MGYENIEILLRSTGTEVAYLEATIKLHYSGSEWIPLSEYNNLIKDINKLIAIRPIANPF